MSRKQRMTVVERKANYIEHEGIEQAKLLLRSAHTFGEDASVHAAYVVLASTFVRIADVRGSSVSSDTNEDDYQSPLILIEGGQTIAERLGLNDL